MRHYIGHDGFIWWIGIVESTDDPLELGRCKVRCFGYHPSREDNLVPPEDLPWAMTLMPANLQNFYGRPNAGDWVMGFFLDSDLAQEPVILGILPAKPEIAEKYFGMHPRFAKTFTKIKNDETPNRTGIINTTKSLKNSSNQLVTLPAEGTYLSKGDLQSVAQTLSSSQEKSEETIGLYEKNGNIISIVTDETGKSTINIQHSKGTKIEINSIGEVSIISDEKINLTSQKDIFVSGTGGTYSLTEKIKSMDVQIEVAKTLPEPPP